jgi:hypothetical protein
MLAQLNPSRLLHLLPQHRLLPSQQRQLRQQVNFAVALNQ